MSPTGPLPLVANLKMESQDKLGVSEVVLNYNKLAMEHVWNSNTEMAQDLLGRAESILKKNQLPDSNRLWLITLNNLATLYKRSNLPRVALKYLDKALNHDTAGSENLVKIAETHLNICALRSEIGEHKLALSHSIKALKILKANFEKDPSVINSLAIAYHNAGLESHYLNQTPQAVKFFKEGKELAAQHLGENHPLTLNLKNYYQKFNLDSNHRKSINNSQKAVKVKASQSASPKQEVELPPLSEGPRKKRTKTKNQKSSVYSSIWPSKTRFLTGERLQPMFSVPVNRYKKKRAHPVKKLIKELDGVHPRDTPDSKVKYKTYQKQLDTSLHQVRSMDTPESKVKYKPRQVDTPLRHKAASLIQKFWKAYRRRTLSKNKMTVKSIDSQEAKLYLSNSTGKKNKRYQNSPKKPRKLKPIEESELYLRKVILIQSFIRRYLVRKRFSKEYNAAVIIQKHVRRYTTRKLYLIIREAIIFIQSQFREYLHRKLKSN